MTITTASDLIDQHDDHPEDVRETAKDLATHDETWASGKTPRGIAAAALYVAYMMERPLDDPGDGRPTQMDLAGEFDTSAVTLRDRMGHLREVASEMAEAEG